jgi:hypothetical protein
VHAETAVDRAGLERAARPTVSMCPSASRANSGFSSNTRRPTPACITITFTAWPRASCSSRASRARSSTSTRDCSAAAWLRLLRTASPDTIATVMTAATQNSS